MTAPPITVTGEFDAYCVENIADLYVQIRFRFFFFIIIFISYYFFYLCVLFTFIFVCVCVCGFFVYMGWVFLTGGGCMVPCNCTKDKNSIKQSVACVVCYSCSKYGTYFLITRVYCGFRL